MGRFFRRLWSYFGASANSKFDEKADPRIQIEQAVAEAQKRHQQLTQQAAAVIGNQRQLEMKLSRQSDDVTKLQASARQAIVLADAARAKGAEADAANYESTAQTFASQLVSGEQALDDLKTLHGQSVAASDQAKQMVQQNAQQLQKFLGERTKLLTQLESAKMQETVSRQLAEASQLAAPGDAPTLDQVRDKIEKRYATALGQAELANDSVSGKMLEVEQASIDTAAQSRLAEIRASLGSSSAPAAPAIDTAKPGTGSSSTG